MTTPAPPSPDTPTFARRPVLAVAGVTALAHVVAAALGGGYYFDESPVLSLGRHHLAWGSADQPPLAPALAWLADTVAPGSILALRLPVVLATAATVLVVALVARELGGDRRAQVIAAGAQATAFWPSLTGHWLVPYALESVQWALLCWLLVRWTNRRDDRLLLAFGVVAGVAVLTKFQVGLLCAALVLAVAVCGPRHVLRRPATGAAAVIAALVAAPTLVWQAQNGWPQLRMASVAAAETGILYGGRLGTAVLLVLIAGVPGAVLAVYGAVRLLRGGDLRTFRFLGVAALGLYVVFVATAGRFYYLAGMLGVLAAAGAVGLQRRRERRHDDGRPPRRAWPWFVLGTATAVLTLTTSVQSVDPAVPTQITESTASAYRALPPEQRAHTAVVTDSYIVAGYLDGYGPRLGLPQAYSGNRAYGYLPPPPPDTDTVVWSAEDPAPLRPWFADVRPAGERVWLATGRTAPWTEIWPALRTLSVS